MLDDSYNDEPTEFEGPEGEADEVTVFEPNPWGARQRIAPPRRFLAKVRTLIPEAFPILTPALTPAGIHPASIDIRPQAISIPSMPSLAPRHFYPAAHPFHPPVRSWPTQPRRDLQLRALLARYAAPICGGIAVLLLHVAYIAKPRSENRARLAVAASLAPTSDDVVVAPITMPVVAMPVVQASEPVRPELIEMIEEPTVPAQTKAAPRAAKSSKTPKARVNKRPGKIRIDAKDLATPLGRLRPGKA